MKDDDEYYSTDKLGLPGRASKVDKWKFDDTLNTLARNAYFTMGNPWFTYWAKRFKKALRTVNVENLPLRDIIDEVDNKLSEELYWSRVDQLRLQHNIWCDPMKRYYYTTKWEEEYWDAIFDRCMDLATKAGFTFHLDTIDEGVALRV